jgi:hypothetical protein
MRVIWKLFSCVLCLLIIVIAFSLACQSTEETVDIMRHPDMCVGLGPFQSRYFTLCRFEKHKARTVDGRLLILNASSGYEIITSDKTKKYRFFIYDWNNRSCVSRDIAIDLDYPDVGVLVATRLPNRKCKIIADLDRLDY